jgi:uncharacterized integral membrane protein (TIGR00698 family)
LTLFPGVMLCLLVAFLAIAVQSIEQALFGPPYIEAIVIAILLGMAVRTFWEPGERWRAGIAFSAKQLLEVAIVFLGASISASSIAGVGGVLFSAVVSTVIVALAFTFAISRWLGLSKRVAILVACGNSICGNSAIAAVAPVIGASGDDVASSISFTAILGVLTVLGLPLLIPLLALSQSQYGILAGLTVYAVPQVLAATMPAGLASAQLGTLVKLIRVLMIGPVVVGLSLFAHRLTGVEQALPRPSLFCLVPWFIIGFVALATFRSMNLVPDAVIEPLTRAASFLTILSMAGLGLGVDVRVLVRIGSRTTAAVTLSLTLLLAMSVIVVRLIEV